jgi:hypothetical protein
LRVGLHLRCIFPCYAAEHAIIHLDRYLYRLYDRRTNSRDLGRRHALLFGSVAQCRRCLCGVVARVSSVKMIGARSFAQPRSAVVSTASSPTYRTIRLTHPALLQWRMPELTGLCGTGGGDIRPDFDWDKGAQIAPRPSSLTVWAYIREAGSHTPAPDVPPITAWRTRMGPGRALVPYARAGTPAVNDTGTTGRTVTAGPASVCGISGADNNTGNNDEKSRDQKGSHISLHQKRI